MKEKTFLNSKELHSSRLTGTTSLYMKDVKGWDHLLEASCNNQIDYWFNIAIFNHVLTWPCERIPISFTEKSLNFFSNFLLINYK